MTTQKAHRLRSVFDPASIAAVGVSERGGWGATTLDNLVRLGFRGEVSVVHPRLSYVHGKPAVSSLSMLDRVPDAIAVSIPAVAVPDVLEEAISLGVAGAVVYASGYAEVGAEGAALQRRIVEICRDRLALVGPNCLGVVGYRTRAALWGIDLAYHGGAGGAIALAAQSGNLALTTMLSGRLPDLAYAASLGNQAATDVVDCLEFYLTDPMIRVVALVIEGIGDLQRFRELALRAAELDVAVVALKVGRSKRGEAATLAHTGTLAGSDAAYDAVFAQTGVIRVADLDELIATCSLLASPRRTRARSLGLFASSGGECGLLADLAEQNGLQLAEVGATTESRLKRLIPSYGYVSNPFDLTAGGWGSAEIYDAAATALAENDEVDFVAFAGDAPTHGVSLEAAGWPSMLAGVQAASDRTGVPMALMTSATDTDPALAALCREYGVTMLAGFGPAMRSLALVARRAEVLDDRDRHLPARAATSDRRAAIDAARRILAGAEEIPSESDAKAVLRVYGLAVPSGGPAKSLEEAVGLAEEVGYPVVCKVEAEGLAHKSDIGGVILGLTDAAQVREAMNLVMDRARQVVPPSKVTGVRIEASANVAAGVELIVGGRNEPSGSMVVIGAGGILTELLRDAATLLWPFDAHDVERALRSLKVMELLDGYRGRGRVDLVALCDHVVRLGQLLADLPEIVELDVNPLLCVPDLEAPVALDALIRQRAHQSTPLTLEGTF